MGKIPEGATHVSKRSGKYYKKLPCGGALRCKPYEVKWVEAPERFQYYLKTCLNEIPLEDLMDSYLEGSDVTLSV